MDSGLIIVLVPLTFLGGLVISFVLRLLTQSRRWWFAVLPGALLPPSLLLAADLIDSGGAYVPNVETFAAMAAIWAAALVPAFVGGLCGAFVGARAKRRHEF